MTREKKKILIMDDDPDLRRLLSLCLKIGGFDTVSAANGLDAIGMMEDERPSAIISEWTLPIIDGERFLHWLRSEARLDTPVLILTAHDSPEASEHIMSAGASKVLFKPAGARKILSALNPLLYRNE